MLIAKVVTALSAVGAMSILEHKLLLLLVPVQLCHDIIFFVHYDHWDPRIKQPELAQFRLESRTHNFDGVFEHGTLCFRRQRLS